MSDGNDRPKPKDFWDKLGVIGAPLIAATGLWFTYTYNKSQDEQKTFLAQQQSQQQQAETAHKRELDLNQLNLQRLETIEKLYSELISNEAKRRETAIKLIKNSGDDQLATRVAAVFGSPNEPNAALEDVFAKPSAVPLAPVQPSATPSAANATVEGWAYLGDFNNNSWKTQYFNFAPNAAPSSLVGSTQVVSRVTGDLNVRSGMPTLYGAFPDVLDVLPPGTRVMIVSVQPWLTSTYQWAYVRYARPKK